MTDQPHQTQPPATDIGQQVDTILQQRLAVMTQTVQQPQGFVPIQQTVTPATAPTPTSLHIRVAIPMPDGRELPGYVEFAIPPGLENPTGIQQLSAMIAGSWPVQTYQPRNAGWGGQSNGGGGYSGGYKRGNYGRGGYGGGRRW